MAHSTALVRRDDASRTALVVTTGNRTADIARAQRHSSRVRWLRYGLPVACIALAGAYTFTVMKKAGVGSGLPLAALQKILPENLTMDNPHYEGFGRDGSSYVLDAKTAQQDLATPTVIKLNGISGTIAQTDKSRTQITAASGSFDNKANVLELFQSIKVTSDSGLKAELTQATIKTKENLLFSKEPVLVEFPAGTIRSNAMTFRQKTREVTFDRGVAARLKPQAATEKPALTPLPASAAGLAAPGPGANGLFKASAEPLDVTAERLDIRDAAKVARFSGAVTAKQGEATMSTPELEISYEGDAAQASAQPAAAAGKVRRIAAKGPVVMTRGAEERVDSDAAEFDAVNETAVLTGNVVMSAGADRKASSDRVDLDQRADTALLTGTVFVQQGKNELKGRRLFIDRSAGKAQLTSPPGAGSGPGRVNARLYQGQSKDTAKAKSQPAAAKEATGAAPGVGSFKTDPDAPVDIEADQLDVNDGQKQAIFRGNVKAVQGDFVINTGELVASYSGEAKLADVRPADGAAATGDKKQTELTRIDAKKHVVVTSKDGQMVRGDWATYDAKANTVTVGGEVSLSKGESMVRGTRLVIDMVSGESTIETAGEDVKAKAGEAGWMTAAPEAGNRGRPSAVLFPQGLRDQEGKKKPPLGATTGWSTEQAQEPQSPQRSAPKN